MVSKIIQLGDGSTSCVFGLASLGPGTYGKTFTVRGSGILSTLFVKSVDVGATLAIEYFDATTGRACGEEIPLDTHTLVDDTTVLPFNHQVCLDKLHSPQVRAVVTGGNVEFGVMASARDFNGLETVKTTDSDGDDCIRVCGESVPQGLSALGQIDLVTVFEASWTETLVVPMPDRRAFAIQNTNGLGVDNPDPVLLNYAPFAPGGANIGWRLDPGESKFIDASDGVNIFIRIIPGGTTSFPIVFEQLK